MNRIAAVEIPKKLMEILYGYSREICKFCCYNVKFPVLVLTYHSVSLLLAETNLLSVLSLVGTKFYSPPIGPAMQTGLED